MSVIRVAIILFLSSLLACAQESENQQTDNQEHMYKVNKTEEEWKEELSPEEYRVLREKGTERAFSNEYNDNKKEGVYYCAACHNTVFTSKTKFNSGTGWPSFFAPVSKESVVEILDKSHGMIRTEVVCANCGGHLGHVFNDALSRQGLDIASTLLRLILRRKIFSHHSFTDASIQRWLNQYQPSPFFEGP